MHVRAALRNGLTPDEIKEVLLQTARLLRRAGRQRRLRDRPGRARRGGGARDARRAALGGAHARSGATAARSRTCAPDDLAAIAIAAAVERAGVEPAEIEDVYFGCANQAGEDNRNVARMARAARGPAAVGRRRDA